VLLIGLARKKTSGASRWPESKGRFQKEIKAPGWSRSVLRQKTIWLGWAYLTKKAPHAATTPIATAFKICISHRKNGLLNRLPEKVSFSVFD
jgi:hypothetical protein